MHKPNRSARAIVVTKHGQSGAVIARTEVDTLEQARAFLDNLNSDGTPKSEAAAGSGGRIRLNADAKQATPSQQQQAKAGNLHCSIAEAAMAAANRKATQHTPTHTSLLSQDEMLAVIDMQKSAIGSRDATCAKQAATIAELVAALRMMEEHFSWHVEHDTHHDSDLVMLQIARAALAKVAK